MEGGGDVFQNSQRKDDCSRERLSKGAFNKLTSTFHEITAKFVKSLDKHEHKIAITLKFTLFTTPLY